MDKVEIVKKFISIIQHGQKAGAFNIKTGALMAKSCKYFTEKNYSSPDIKDRNEALQNIIVGLELCQQKGLFAMDTVIEIDEMIKFLITNSKSNDEVITKTMGDVPISMPIKQNEIPSSDVNELINE